MPSSNSISRLALALLLTVLSIAAASSREAAALPPGRAWAHVGQLAWPGVDRFGTNRIDVDSSGVLRLIAKAIYFTDNVVSTRWSAFFWQDTTWAAPVFGTEEAGFFPWPPGTDSPGYPHVVWFSENVGGGGLGRMLLARVDHAGFGPSETAMAAIGIDTEYGAAIAPGRRWVVRSEPRIGEQVFRIRLATRPDPGFWVELPRIGIDEDHCTVAALNDSSAMVAFAGESGLSWAIAAGEAWSDSGNIDRRPFAAAHPRLRPRPSGGHWLLWTERAQVHMSYFDGTSWHRGDSLKCDHGDELTYSSSWADASRDTAERPVLAWGDVGGGVGRRDVICVAFPTSTGWSTPEEVPGSVGSIIPSVARDRFGDAWISWFPIGIGGLYYTHTYCNATVVSGVVSGTTASRSLEWRLDRLAPGSSWTVERATQGGDFQPIATIMAGLTDTLRGSDTSAATGSVQYRLQRNSSDVRYRLNSAPIIWQPSASGPPRLEILPRPSTTSPTIRLINVPRGQYELRIYDIGGRLVGSRPVYAGGTGLDVMAIDRQLEVHAGVFFARLFRGDQAITQAGRMVILE